QHIREAVGRPGLTDRRFMGPVLATFVHALPRAMAPAEAPPGTAVNVRLTGEAGGDWSLVAGPRGWALRTGAAPTATATVTLDQSLAWRLFTRTVRPETAAAAVAITGDGSLGARA